ncbi:L,D-transpeptidase family protein [Lysobacter tyrosinilyticus]
MFRLFFLVLALLITGTSAATKAPRVDLVRVDKSDRTLALVSAGKVIRLYKVVLGRAPVGAKTREGDKRTPEGRYVLNLRNANSSYYRSIHVSYPNAQDLERARRLGVNPGSAIMIHGQPNGRGWNGDTLQYDWTDGCIALSNADMTEVWNLVRIPTPIEIGP